MPVCKTVIATNRNTTNVFPLLSASSSPVKEDGIATQPSESVNTLTSVTLLHKSNELAITGVPEWFKSSYMAFVAGGLGPEYNDFLFMFVALEVKLDFQHVHIGLQPKGRPKLVTKWVNR